MRDERSAQAASMYRGMAIGVVIPARDEEGHIRGVVADLLALPGDDASPAVDDCVVCDNGSTDATAASARTAGARVVSQATPGYGIACQTGVAALDAVDAVLFVDGDGSFRAEQALGLLDAIADGADLAIGARPLGRIQSGALSLPQRLGNRLAALLIGWLWQARVSDLGPYRAIRAKALAQLRMRDRAFGWTVEMQVKAIQQRLRVAEVPVDTLRRRYGKSKVGGTWRGVVGASWGILTTIAALRWQQRKLDSRGSGA